MAELDHDLLKKTAGLLADIDRVAATPSVAERVSRVIESAAPNLREDTFDSVEAWDWHRSGYSYSVVDPDRLHTEHHRASGGCGCESVWVAITTPDDERESLVLECAAHTPLRDEPIFWTKAPYHLFGEPHAAQKPCGAKGCACSDLWAPPPRIEWMRPQGQETTFTVFDEISEGTNLHERMQLLFMTRQAIRQDQISLLLDISVD